MGNKSRSFSQKKVKKTFVLQHDQSDCGVACLSSLINYYGGNGDLEKLRRLSGTTKQGTTLLGLYQAANQLGFSAEGKVADLKALMEHPEPVILHTTIEKRLQHYIICYGFYKNTFIIGDPARGIITYTSEKLEKIWKSKTCLTLAPTVKFETKVEQHSAKKKWFINLLKKDVILIRFSILLGIGIAVLGMAMAIFSQKLIDEILPSKDFNKLVIGIILVGMLLLIKIAFSSLRDYFLIKQTKDFNNRIINQFYSALLNLPKLFFDTRKIGELVSRLNDTERVQRVIKTIVGNVIINALTALVSTVFLFYYSWETGCIALSSLPFYFLLMYGFNKRIIQAQKNVMQSYALSESNYIASMLGISAIKNNNRQRFFQKINKIIYGNYQDKTFYLGKINIRLSMLSGIFSILFLIGVLTYNSIQVFHDNLQLGELMAILGISGNLLPAVASLALITIPINEAKVAFYRMYEFASMEKEDQGNIKLGSFEKLDIKNLSFRFPGRSKLLKDISLSVHKNECVAIVGESGCGKSTLAQILQKFYPFESGSITINKDSLLEKVRTTDWRNLIGVVPQEITLFNGSVIDNILMGNETDIQKINDFCIEYGFHNFINELPQGYTTILGEEGINLSGGQKQIIGLMRALYHNPQLLILDEPTSAMDRTNEKFVLALLKQLKSNLTIILISHRIHSLPIIADKIYIIEDRTISNFGTHQKLMQSQNFYSTFWSALEAYS